MWYFQQLSKNLSAKDNYVKNAAVITVNQPVQSLQDSLKIKLAKQKAEADKKQAEKQKANVDLEKEIAIRMESQELIDKEIKADIERKLADERYKVDQKKYEEHQKQYDAEQKRYDAEQKRYDIEQKRYESKQKQYEVQQKISEEIQKARSKKHSATEIPVPSVPPTPPTPPIHLDLNVPVAVPAAPTPPVYQNEYNSFSETSSSHKAKSSSKVSIKTGTQRVVESVTSTDTDDHDYKSIIKDLIKDGIIKTQNKLSYKLDKNGFIINGVKQSSSFHQKYKSKYLPKSNSALLYEYQETNNN